MSALPNGPSTSVKRLVDAQLPGADFRPVDRDEIEKVVQSVVATLRGDMTAEELSLYAELEGLSRFIRHAKTEIAALRPDEIQDKHLPIAADELDAIVGATEQATHVILDSVEKIERASAELSGESKQAIGNAITNIYEACNFQDITGQRINKVVRTLKQIEDKVAGLVKAFGDEIQRHASIAHAAGPAAPASGTEADKALLNGPQLPGNGNTQADIDALFGSD
jgi:chemotaxis protein CheZ